MLKVGQKVIIKEVQPNKKHWWTNQMYQFCGMKTYITKVIKHSSQSNYGYELNGIKSKHFNVPFTLTDEDLLEVK